MTLRARDGANNAHEREILSTKTHAIFWTRFDTVTSIIRIKKELDHYPPLDLETFK